jgi:hypothetical protein
MTMATTKKTKQTKQTPQPQTTQPTRSRRRRAPGLPAESDIAKRAYQLFIERGGEHGRDMDDWLSAQRELLPQDN